MSANMDIGSAPEKEGSGAVCLMVIAFAVVVCAVVLCVMAFKPQGHPLGTLLPEDRQSSGSGAVRPAPR